MRLACLHVPAFPLAAWGRVDPELHGRPVAVTDGRGPRARVVALSPEAVRRGLSLGRSAAQSVAICADLALRPASADAERAAQAALCDVADACSPRVEDAGAGTVYLDCGPGEHGEAELARLLVERAAQVGFELSVGIASTKLAARLAARDGGGVAVIPRAEEWRFLAPLPIRLLEPGPALLETLARWGIRCLGDLAALPASAVATRLGPEGALLARRARGEDESALMVRPAPVCFEEAVELEYGLEALDPFAFVVRALLDRLTARLAVRGLVCGDLRVALRLANCGRDERTVTVAMPGNDAKALLALVRLQLESAPPAAPVEAIRVAAVPERLRPAQLDLFRPRGPAPEQLAVTLARLAALCGAERVVAPARADSHRPDAYGVAVFADGSRSVSSRREDGGPKPGRMRVALRAIRPPRALEVFTNRGELDFVRPRCAALPPSAGDRDRETYACTGRVVNAAGPWRVEGEWWQSDGFSRNYYDVQLSDGGIYRLFYDAHSQTWFADGVYD